MAWAEMVRCYVTRQIPGHYAFGDLRIQYPNPSVIISEAKKTGVHNAAVVCLPKEMATAGSLPQYDAMRIVGKAPKMRFIHDLHIGSAANNLRHWDAYQKNNPPTTRAVSEEEWKNL